MPVFHKVDGKLKKLGLLSLDKEKDLQRLVEDNLFTIWDMHLLYSEYPTTDRGRIDTLAIDSDGAPVIIEYKRNRNDNVINQALSYLKWLKSQKVEFFEMLVIKKLGPDKVSKIDWKNPKVICIAEEYSKFDLDTLEVISVRLELYRYYYYENNIFTLENVKSEEGKPKYVEHISVNKETSESGNTSTEIGLEAHLSKGQANVQELYFKVQSRIFELGEDIEKKINNNYIAFKVSKIFAEVHIQKSKLLLYLRPKIIYNDPENRVTKVPDSFNWVLNHRIYIDNVSDIDYVMVLIEQSYKDVL